MKREELEKIGLSTEQVDAVMKLYGTSVQADKDRIARLEQDAAASKTQIDGLNEQIAKRDEDITALKKSAVSADDLSGKLTELQAKYDADTKALTGKLEAQAYDYAADRFLDGYSFSSKAARRSVLADMKGSKTVKYADGQLVGAKEFIEDYKKNEPDCFKADEKEGAEHSGAAATTEPAPRFTPVNGGVGGNAGSEQGGNGFSLSGFNLVRQPKQ